MSPLKFCFPGLVNMKCFVSFLVVLFSVAQLGYCAMTDAQVKAAVKLARNVCQPKTKAPSDEITAMHEGKWASLSTPTKCYLACTLNTYKMITKDNKLNSEQALKQIKQLPEDLKKYCEKGLEVCKDSAKTNEKCEAAYEISQCMYNVDPEKYFLP